MKRSKMVKMIKTIVNAVVGTEIIIGIMILLGNLVEWLCADTRRYLIGAIIGVYAIYRILKKELG